MLADELDYVVGVDTHRDQHVLAVVAAPMGALIAQRSAAANARGYAEAIGFAERFAPGVRVWAVEGAGHYGTRAARSALASNQPASPRSGQRQEVLRVLLLTRRSAVGVRRVALVQLRSVISGLYRPTLVRRRRYALRRNSRAKLSA
jgi:transposase